jgi:ABC-type multidrug transport system ATPase subunit
VGISLDQISVHYGEVYALNRVDLELGSGITAVMGRNGAGKTTLLQVTAGILAPTSGMLKWNGTLYLDCAGEVRESLGYLPQMVDFPERLTPRKLITFLARLRFLEPMEGQLLMEQLGLFQFMDRRFGEMSLGEIRMVGIAQALMGSPRLILLDEFTRNLSYEERRLVYRKLQGLSAADSRRMIVFSTHLMEDVLALADRLVLLKEGRVVFAGEIPDLLEAARALDGVEPNRTPGVEEACLRFLQKGD